MIEKWEAWYHNGRHWVVHSDVTLIADCFNTHESEKNARLIAAAPELLEMLKEELIPISDYGGILSFERERRVRELLDRIEGKLPANCQQITGKWITDSTHRPTLWHCSVCHQGWYKQEENPSDTGKHFCYYCGAKMEKGGSNGDSNDRI